MLIGKANRNLARWLAMMAMALNALWPMIVNAKPGYADLIQDICSVSPANRPARAHVGMAHLAGSKHLSPHCALCSVGSDKPAALAPSLAEAALAIGSTESATPHSIAPPHASLCYSAARPRGPPSLS